MRIYADASALGAIYWPTSDSALVAEAAGKMEGIHTSELAAAQLEHRFWQKLRDGVARVRRAEAYFREDVESGWLRIESMNQWDDAWQFTWEWNRGRLSLAVPVTHLVHPALAALNGATAYLSAHPAARERAQSFGLAIFPARLAK